MLCYASRNSFISVALSGNLYIFQRVCFHYSYSIVLESADIKTSKGLMKILLHL